MQCNACGSFEEVEACKHCPTLLCHRCSLRHAPLCEELQKRKNRGEGRTIANAPLPQHRAGHTVPPTTPPDRILTKSPVLGAPYDLAHPAATLLAAAEMLGGLRDYAAEMTGEVPAEPVDQGIEAVKDLLSNG